MKCYYLNDTKLPVTIRTIGPAPDCHHTFTELQPQEGRLFDIIAPDRAVMFVKRWDNGITLLSYTMDSAIVDAPTSDMPSVV
jgi:hypothetical protein